MSVRVVAADVHKSFGGVHAVRGLSLDLEETGVVQDVGYIGSRATTKQR